MTDLSPLNSLSHLDSLLCHKTKISDLTPLSTWSELRILNIKGTEVKTLAPLLQCKKLKYLNNGNLKDQNKDQTEGYLRCIKEQMPELKCSELDVNSWWNTIPSDMKHSWYRY